MEITGIIPADSFGSFRKKALENIGKTVKIDGFRTGHIPEKVLVEKLGEMSILEEAAELALKDAAPDIIEKHAAKYIGRPKIAVTKLAPNNPLEFKITIAVRPTLKLPDYKKIAREELAAGKADATKNKIEITEKEIDDVIEEIRREYAHRELHKQEKVEHHDHAPEELEKLKPAVTDEFVKTVGTFTSVADFREKIKENLTREKEHRAHQVVRAKILEKLLEKTDVPAAQILVDFELDRMTNQFESDVAGMGITVDRYLEHLKKTREEIRTEWHPEAVKRAKLNLVLEDIAVAEKIEPTAEEIDTEVTRLTKQHPDISKAAAASYINHALMMEKAIAFLEKQ